MLMCLLLPLAASGCNAFDRSTGGTVQLRSIADGDQRFDTQFTHGLYRQDDETTATMVVFDGPMDQPRRAMTVRLFWTPRAGATPLHADATNATMHYMIFDEGGDAPTIAIYTGAGFIFPRGRLGRETLRVRMLDASIRLADAADGFHDPIGHGQLVGDIIVTHDPDATGDAIDQLNDLVRDRLGRSRLVHAD